MNPESVNPFEAPQTSQPRPEFGLLRWRIIPATLSILFGGLISLYGACMLLVPIYFAHQGTVMPIREFALFLTGGAMATTCGITWLAAGVVCLKRKWWLAFILWGTGTAAAGGFGALVLAFPNG